MDILLSEGLNYSKLFFQFEISEFIKYVVNKNKRTDSSYPIDSRASLNLVLKISRRNDRGSFIEIAS